MTRGLAGTSAGTGCGYRVGGYLGNGYRYMVLPLVGARGRCPGVSMASIGPSMASMGPNMAKCGPIWPNVAQVYTVFGRGFTQCLTKLIVLRNTEK